MAESIYNFKHENGMKCVEEQTGKIQVNRRDAMPCDSGSMPRASRGTGDQTLQRKGRFRPNPDMTTASQNTRLKTEVMVFVEFPDCPLCRKKASNQVAFKMIPFQAEKREGTAFPRTPAGFGHSLRARPIVWRSARVMGHPLEAWQKAAGGSRAIIAGFASRTKHVFLHGIN